MLGLDEFSAGCAMVNRVTVDYLQMRGNEMDSSMAILMADEAFGTYENHMPTSPSFFERMGSV